MAGYTITYSCGHTITKQLYGPSAQRDRYIAWAEKLGECGACKKADAVIACEVVEGEYGLPEMAGSAKQIAWARDIRASLVPPAVEYKGLKDEVRSHIAEFSASKADAKWWIDNRAITALDLAKMAYVASQAQK